VGINKSQIAPTFKEKLEKAIRKFAQKNNVANTDLRILIVPKDDNIEYHIVIKGVSVSQVSFNELIQLNMLEAALVNDKKVAEYIINSLNKMSIGAVCSYNELNVLIFMNKNETIEKLALLKNNQIINYFTIDNFF
jgi:hypothetical protein